MATTSTIGTTTTAGGIAEMLSLCPLCAESSFKRLPTPGHWIGEDVFSAGEGVFGVCRCQSCSLSFINPRPTKDLLDAFYHGSTYVCHEAGSGDARASDFLLERVAHYGPYEGRRLLDFGCGGGFLLRGATEAHWDAFGFDVGPRALASCRSQGLTVTDNLKDYSSSSFDVMFLNHVFEHIADPPALLRTCRNLLRQSGKLFIAVPNLAGLRARLSLGFLSRNFNVDERCRAFPIHLFYFTPHTLKQMLEGNGLRVVAIETFGFGMEEFINRPDSDVKEEVMAPSARKSQKDRGLKQIVKKAFFGAGLGENLLAIACPK